MNCNNLLDKKTIILLIILIILIYIIFIYKKEENVDVSVCVDTNPSCSDWAKRGECQINPNYMLINCPVSCNTCDRILRGQTTKTPQPTPQPTPQSTIYEMEPPINNQAEIRQDILQNYNKCTNNKADKIQQIIIDLLKLVNTYEDEDRKKNTITNSDGSQSYQSTTSPYQLLLKQDIHDKLKDIVNILKTVSNDEFNCLYVKDNSPYNVCKEMKKLTINNEFEEELNDALENIMYFEQLVKLYHKEIMDLKTIIIPKMINFIVSCGNMTSGDKKNILKLMKKILTIINYIAYVVGGNNNLIIQIDSALKSIG